MNEEDILEEEQEQEDPVTTTTTSAQESPTTTTISMNGQTVIFNLNNDDSSGESLPDNSENIIHQLFNELGCNLDYTPKDVNQRFTMTLQFAAALWFIWWFIKFLWTTVRDMFRA